MPGAGIVEQEGFDGVFGAFFQETWEVSGMIQGHPGQCAEPC